MVAALLWSSFSHSTDSLSHSSTRTALGSSPLHHRGRRHSDDDGGRRRRRSGIIAAALVH